MAKYQTDQTSLQRSRHILQSLFPNSSNNESGDSESSVSLQDNQHKQQLSSDEDTGKKDESVDTENGKTERVSTPIEQGMVVGYQLTNELILAYIESEKNSNIFGRNEKIYLVRDAIVRTEGGKLKGTSYIYIFKQL